VGGTALVVVCALVVLEIFSRTTLVRASKDLSRFERYPAEAKALEQVQARRIALIGNSATDRGVDLPTFDDVMTTYSRRPTDARKFVADASRINDWTFILERYFWRPGVSVDLAVVTFYENELEDGNRIEIGRLAQFFTTTRDWPTLFSIDLPTVGDKAEFLVASGWMTYAVSSRIRDRVLTLVPAFRSFTQAVNGENLDHLILHQPAPGSGPQAPRSYRALDRLLARAKEHGTRILFVAYPTAPAPGRAPYVVPADTIARIQAAGMGYLDMRGRAPAIEPRHYDDDVHLNAEGAVLYARALAIAMAWLAPAAGW
jgi:hypothetical protein